jgi:hypothetical protein
VLRPRCWITKEPWGKCWHHLCGYYCCCCSLQSQPKSCARNTAAANVDANHSHACQFPSPIRGLCTMLTCVATVVAAAPCSPRPNQATAMRLLMMLTPTASTTASAGVRLSCRVQSGGSRGAQQTDNHLSERRKTAAGWAGTTLTHMKGGLGVMLQCADSCGYVQPQCAPGTQCWICRAGCDTGAPPALAARQYGCQHLHLFRPCFAPSLCASNPPYDSLVLTSCVERPQTCREHHANPLHCPLHLFVTHPLCQQPSL